MPHCFVDPTESDLLPLFPVAPGNWGAASEGARAWAARTGFKADPGTICVYPHADGVPAGALVGIGSDPAPWDWAAVAARLPAGGYRIAAPLEADEAERAALGWVLGGYRFDRYRAVEASEPSRLAWPEGVDGDRILRLRDSIFLVRDLINTPAGGDGPGGTVGGGGGRGRGVRCRLPGNRRRRSAERRLPVDPCRRRIQSAPAAPDRHPLGGGGRAARDPGRQGGLLRYRGARHQAGRRDEADEEGHGRRGPRAGPGPRDHGGVPCRSACGC